MAPILTLLLAGAAGWTPDRAQIARLEARLVLPAGAAPLPGYDRRYAGIVRNGRRLIAGRLVAAPRPPGGWRIVDAGQLAWTADRGCGAIRLDYDPATGRFGEISCGRPFPRRSPRPDVPAPPPR